MWLIIKGLAVKNGSEKIFFLFLFIKIRTSFGVKGDNNTFYR